MRNSSPSLAGDILGRWRDGLLSWSALAEQQRGELIDWSINLTQSFSQQKKVLTNALRLKEKSAAAVEDSAADWLRLMGSYQTFYAEQMRKTAELLRCRSASEAQTFVVSLAEGAQSLLRVNAHLLRQAGARLLLPWADFWLLPGEVESGG